MAVNKFGLFALIVVLLAISGAECRRRHKSGFSNGVKVGVLSATLARIARPQPRKEYIHIYHSFAPKPINGQLPASQPITPVEENILKSAAVDNASGPILKNATASTGEATTQAPNTAGAIICHPSFYGIVGMVTYFIGSGYRLIL